MSNNPYKKKNKSDRIGNFLISFDAGTLKAVKITSLAGNWNIRFREDNTLFSWIKNQMESDEGRKVLHLVFSSYYAATNAVPDKEFLEDIVNAYSRSIDRLKVNSQMISDEDNLKIIAEEKEKHINKKDGI